MGAGTADLLQSRGWDVTRAEIKQQQGIARLDVTDAQTWSRVVASQGPLDAVVNCAGIRPRCRVLDLSLEEWEQTIRVNLTGCFLGPQTIARALTA